MEIELKAMFLETVRICNTCGAKIRKGNVALNLIGEEIYFCNEKCLMKNSEKTDYY